MLGDSTLKIKQVRELFDLNMELLQVNLKLWKIQREYLQRNHLDYPYDSKIDYTLHQALDLIQSINQAGTPEMKHRKKTPEDDNGIFFGKFKNQ